MGNNASFRSGCSMTLSLLGVSYEQVAKHVGWKSVHTAIYYSQLDKVMSPDHASTVILEATERDSPKVPWVERPLLKTR